MVTGLRGSYGGVVMIGMLSSVAGLGLFNPLSVGAGLVLGRMAYKEDKENRLLRARAEAKTNVRRFVDDVSFVVGKESRDRLKTIHRTLRDHYRDIANELTRSLNESLQSTITAAHMEDVERDNRIRELERQLDILSQVTDNVDKLTTTGDPRTSVSTSDQVRAILGGTIQAYRGEPAYRQRPGCLPRTGPHRRAAQRTDPHRAGRHAQGGKVHSGQRVGRARTSRRPTPPRPPGS